MATRKPKRGGARGNPKYKRKLSSLYGLGYSFGDTSLPLSQDYIRKQFDFLLDTLSHYTPEALKKEIGHKKITPAVKAKIWSDFELGVYDARSGKPSRNPPEILAPLTEGIATGTGFGIAAGVTTPLVVGAVEKIKKGLKGKRNPNNSAQTLSEEFHGRPSTNTEEFDETEEYRDELAGLGDLTELEVVTKDGKYKLPISFQGDGIRLASMPDGRQLYFVDGEQYLDDSFLKTVGLSKIERNRDAVDLGEVHTISYFADKHHLAGGGKDGAEYIHEFGEEGGSRPMLVYDRLNERLKLVGGSYEVRGEGVVN